HREGTTAGGPGARRRRSRRRISKPLGERQLRRAHRALARPTQARQRGVTWGDARRARRQAEGQGQVELTLPAVQSQTGANIPDPEAPSASGATPAEALAEVEQARAAWLEAGYSEDKPIPEPLHRWSIYQVPA